MVWPAEILHMERRRWREGWFPKAFGAVWESLSAGRRRCPLQHVKQRPQLRKGASRRGQSAAGFGDWAAGLWILKTVILGLCPHQLRWVLFFAPQCQPRCSPKPKPLTMEAKNGFLELDALKDRVGVLGSLAVCACVGRR